MKKIGNIIKTKGQKGGYLIENIPENIHELPEGTKVHIGYTSNFTRLFHIKSWINQNRNASVIFRETELNDNPSEMLEKAIFIDEVEFIESLERVFTGEDTAGFMAIDNETGEKLGLIIEIWEMPANEVWMVDTTRGKLPVPAVEDFIVSVDHDSKEVYINMMEGLWDLIDGGENDEEE